MESKAKFAVYVPILIILLITLGIKHGFKLNSSEMVISNDINPSSFLMLKGLESSENCEHMYGFLPCTNNLLGHLFQILVYEYLLFIGEKCVSAGSESFFKITGTGGFFGACGFNILSALPGATIVLVSGLSKSKETAQQQVMAGVGLLAGSTVFLLTLLWGTCVIVGKCSFSEMPISDESEISTSTNLQYRKHGSFVTGYGINTDVHTSTTARIMVISVIPFIIIQLPRIFNFSFGGRFVILTSLIISILLLLYYFFYQVSQPEIQERRLEYVKLDHLMEDLLRHVQRHTAEKLLTDKGVPNLPIIRRIFESIDLDGDDNISLPELKELIMRMKSGKTHSNNDYQVADILKDFDLNHDHNISKEEFVTVIEKWLVKKKPAISNQRSFSKRPLDDSCHDIMIEDTMNKPLMFEVLKHVQSNASESLLTKDGTPNLPTIRRLFEKFDLDGDNCISPSELKELIQGIKFEQMDLNRDQVVLQLMQEMDANGDEVIHEHEFIIGIKKLINSTLSEASYREAWKETYKMVDEKKPVGGTSDYLSWTCFKSILLMLLGTTILTLLAGPLIDSVQNFSNAARMPSFFISFIVVPLATNSRKAVSAIIAADHKTIRTTSLTFSEIYGGVFMNNILGLSILLTLVYARSLTWDFSAEVLVVLIVCIVMGLLGSFRSKFPLWTCFIAYLLYPFSLALVYVLDYGFGWS